MTKETYDWAVDVLLDAYNNETLERQNCAACAIGNMIAAKKGIKYKITESESKFFGSHYSLVWDTKEIPAWFAYLYDQRCLRYGVNWDMEKERSDVSLIDAEKQQELKCLDLNLQEINLIEFAFEGAVSGDTEKEDQYNGLCAVLDVMKDMVEEDVPHKENKEKFKMAYEKFVSV